MRRWLPILLLCTALPSWAQTTVKEAARVQVHGSVTDSLSGKPVYDCLVAYYTPDGQRKAITPVNSHGHYSLFIPVEDPFELRVEEENGYHDLVKPMAAIPAGTASFRQDLLLQPRP